MAERLRRAEPVSVANHVKAHQSLIEHDWLLSAAELEVNFRPFAEASLFLSSAAPVVPPPPIYGSKCSPISECYIARERHMTTDMGHKPRTWEPNHGHGTQATDMGHKPRTWDTSHGLSLIHI